MPRPNPFEGWKAEFDTSDAATELSNYSQHIYDCYPGYANVIIDILDDDDLDIHQAREAVLETYKIIVECEDRISRDLEPEYLSISPWQREGSIDTIYTHLESNRSEKPYDQDFTPSMSKLELWLSKGPRNQLETCKELIQRGANRVLLAISKHPFAR